MRTASVPLYHNYMLQLRLYILLYIMFCYRLKDSHSSAPGEMSKRSASTHNLTSRDSTRKFAEIEGDWSVSLTILGSGSRNGDTN